MFEQHIHFQVLLALFVPHYGPLIAFNQKVRALASRTETKARDIWDIFHLINSYKIKGGKEIAKKIESKSLLMKFWSHPQNYFI